MKSIMNIRPFISSPSARERVAAGRSDGAPLSILNYKLLIINYLALLFNSFKKNICPFNSPLTPL